MSESDDIMTLEEFDSSSPEASDRSSLKTSDAKTLMTLQDYERFTTERVTPRGVLPMISGSSPEQISEFKKLGKIGFWEGMARGVNDIAALGESATGGDEIEFSHMKAFRVMEAMNRMQANTQGTFEYKDNEQLKLDIQRVDQYLLDITEEETRGRTFGGKVGEGVGAMTEFALSFFLTRGAASTASTSAKNLSLKLLKESAESLTKKSLAKKALVGTVGLTAGAATRTGLLPHLTAKNFSERRVVDSLVLTEKGIRVATEGREKPITSMMKALGDTFIDMFAEETGAAFAPAISGLGRAGKKILPKGITSSLEKVFLKLHPSKKAKDLWTKVGFNGFLAELGEEQLGNILKAATGTQDFGAKNPESTIDRVAASIFGWEELAVTAGVLAFPTVGRITTSSVFDRIRKIKDDTDYKEPKASKTISDEQVNGIIRQEGVREQKIAEERQAVKDIKQPTVEAPEAKPDGTQVKKPEVTKGKPAPKVKVEKTPEPKQPKQPEISEEKKLIAEGRINQLDKEAKELTKAFESLTKERTKKIERNLSTKAIDARIEKNKTKLDAIDKQRGSILTELDPTSQIKARQKILTTAGRAVNTIFKKMKQARSITLEEVKQTQNEVQGIIRKSELTTKDKGKLLRSLSSVRTKEQLEKRLPEIQRVIENVKNEGLRQKAVKEIQKKLKRTKPKKVSGREKGKLTADVQKELDSLRKASTMSEVSAFRKVRENLIELQDPSIDVNRLIDLVLENEAIQKTGGLKRRSLDDALKILDHINGIITGAKKTREAQLEQEKEIRLKKVSESLAAIKGDKPTNPTQTEKERNKGVLARMFMTSTNFIQGWEEMNDIFSKDDITSDAFESKLSEHASVFMIEQELKAANAADQLEIKNLQMDLLGVQDNKQGRKTWQRRLVEDSVIHDWGTLEDLQGGLKRLELSKNEIRKMWMEFQDPALKPDLESAEGGYKRGTVIIDGLTQEMQDLIFNEMDTYDIEFAKAEMKFLKKLYKRFNDKYREINGVDLPFREFYSPIKRVRDGKIIDENFLDIATDPFFKDTNVPKASKARIANKKKVVVQSDIDAVQIYYTSLNHWLKWVDKLKDLNAIYSNSEIRDEIIGKYGSESLAIVDRQINHFVTNGRRVNNAAEKIAEVVRTNFATSAIALKPTVGIKQLSSIPAYMEFVSIKDFVAGMVDYFNPATGGPKAKNDILNKTDILKTRADSMTREIKDLTRSPDPDSFKFNPTTDKLFNAVRNNPTWRNAMWFFVRFNDKTAIQIGGWAVYRQTLRDTGSKDEAVKAFTKATQLTQQSGDLSALSDFQRGGPILQLMSLFKSAPNAYVRRYLAAWRNVSFTGKGRITKKQFLKMILIHHVLLPNLFTLIGNMFQVDEDEHLIHTLLGPVSGIFVLGDMIESLTRVLSNRFLGTSLTEFKISDVIPAQDIVTSLWEALAGLPSDGDIDPEDVWKASKKVLEDTVGPATGTPIKTIGNATEGFSDIMEGNVGEGTAKLMGWTPHIIEKNKGKKRKNKGF